jgi:RNA polymerase sigma-70 factor (ECF subfamily)
VDTAIPFHQLIQRLRQGCPEAAREIVSRYENEVRRAIRVRLTDARLRRTLDSMDICQSVLANFFVRAGKGQFDLSSPEQLIGLLVTMAHNKLIDHARKADVRGRQQQMHGTAGEEAIATAADVNHSPSKMVADRELLEAAHKLLSPQERYVAEQRASGRGWADLAAELGTTPEALRKQHQRALDRVAEALGLDSVGG